MKYIELTAKNKRTLYQKVSKLRKKHKIKVQYTSSIELHGLYIAVVEIL